MLIRNVGKLDRIVRLTIAAIMLYLGAFVYPGLPLGITLATLALIPLMTGTLGFCPFYRLVKFSTCTVRRPS